MGFQLLLAFLPGLVSAAIDQEVSFQVFAEEDQNKTLKQFVCFDNLGCFYRNGTFEHLTHLPDPPEYIQTKFLQYPGGVELNPESPQILKPGRPLIVLIHGFNQDSNSHRFVEMKNSLLKKDPNTNVVIVDWWRGARGPFYFSAAVNAEVVGRQTGRLLSRLSSVLDLDRDVHVVGFSLGAQIAGFTGRWLRTRYGKTLGRITGLDPASPFYEGHGPDVHLTTADANFVDVIHTSAGGSWTSGQVGFIDPIGHVDFYPNGGKGQPHCNSGGIKCNHESSLMFFIQSINNSCHFRAYPCPGGYHAFSRGQCYNCRVNGPCGSMGFSSFQEKGRGSLYLPTRINLPVCGVYVSLLLQSSFSQERTYGAVVVILEGEDTTIEEIWLTKSDDEQIQPGEELQKAFSIPSSMLPFKSLRLRYTAFKGWTTSGSNFWKITSLHLVDEDSNHEFHACFDKEELTVKSGEATELRSGSCV